MGLVALVLSGLVLAVPASAFPLTSAAGRRRERADPGRRLVRARIPPPPGAGASQTFAGSTARARRSTEPAPTEAGASTGPTTIAGIVTAVGTATVIGVAADERAARATYRFPDPRPAGHRPPRRRTRRPV